MLHLVFMHINLKRENVFFGLFCNLREEKSKKCVCFFDENKNIKFKTMVPKYGYSDKYLYPSLESLTTSI